MKVLRDDLANDVVVTQRLKHEVNKLAKFQFFSIVLRDDMERKALM